MSPQTSDKSKKIFLQYPTWAGGKFVWTCLAQSDQVLFPFHKDKAWFTSVYDIHVKWLLEKEHTEFGEKSYIEEFGTEDKFWPWIVETLPEEDVPCLSLYNHKWIRVRRHNKTRTIRLEDLKRGKPHQVKSNTHLFDMQSLLYKNKFLKEIELTCNWLDISMPTNEKHLEHVRELFIKNCHYGFPPNYEL